MVSMCQMQAHLELDKEGWHSVSAPFDIERTPIGGPGVMMNAEGDVIRVYPDGSAARLTDTEVVRGDLNSLAARLTSAWKPITEAPTDRAVLAGSIRTGEMWIAYEKDGRWLSMETDDEVEATHFSALHAIPEHG